jgi:hypothetical protein
MYKFSNAQNISFSSILSLKGLIVLSLCDIWDGRQDGWTNEHLTDRGKILNNCLSALLAKKYRQISLVPQFIVNKQALYQIV